MTKVVDPSLNEFEIMVQSKLRKMTGIAWLIYKERYIGSDEHDYTLSYNNHDNDWTIAIKNLDTLTGIIPKLKIKKPELFL